MFVNSIESLVRDGYQIHVTGTGEIWVYFSSDSQILQQKVWNRDAELIAAFLGGRAVTTYCTLVAKEVPAPLPPACPIATPAAEPTPEPTPEPASVSTSTPFMPTLQTLPERPKQMRVPRGKFASDIDETDYIIYTKEDGNLHLHWKVSRTVAKKMWRESRESIRQWLNGRVLNTVSWAKNPCK